MFDALAARAVAGELADRLERGRIQGVVALDPLSIGLEVYAGHARHYLLASADSALARLHLVSDKLRSSGASSSFLLLLKKHADNAWISRIEAVPRERIIRIEFDQAQMGVSTLVAELMGRRSNLILLDANGAILDSVKRVTPAMSRARAVLPRERYLPPPPQAKADPLTMAPEQLEALLAAAGGEPLWQTLVAEVAGTSPLLARELAFRVTRDANAPSDPALGGRLHAELLQVWTAPPQPTLALVGQEPSDVAAFELTHLTETERLDSMSAALERFFGAVESYAAVKAPLREQLEAARDRMERKRAALEREIVPPEQVDRLRISGEMILAHTADIAQGQELLRAEMLDAPPLEIRLDPDRTPVENAQKYFAEYRRAKDAAESVPARLREAQADVAFAEQVLEDLEEAEDRGEIDAAIAEAREAGLLSESKLIRPRGGRAAPAGPRRFQSPDGFDIIVGRNAQQNEEVTFRLAGAEDLWLHARGTAGAHVVILCRGQLPPESTVEFAAGLAGYYSGARQEAWADVIVAPRKNVRRVTGRGLHPGLVTIRDERNVRVRPGAPES